MPCAGRHGGISGAVAPATSSPHPWARAAGAERPPPRRAGHAPPPGAEQPGGRRHPAPPRPTPIAHRVSRRRVGGDRQRRPDPRHRRATGTSARAHAPNHGGGRGSSSPARPSSAAHGDHQTDRRAHRGAERPVRAAGSSGRARHQREGLPARRMLVGPHRRQSRSRPTPRTLGASGSRRGGPGDRPSPYRSPGATRTSRRAPPPRRGHGTAPTTPRCRTSRRRSARRRGSRGRRGTDGTSAAASSCARDRASASPNATSDPGRCMGPRGERLLAVARW